MLEQPPPPRIVERPDDEGKRLRALVVEQAALIGQQHECIQELEARIQTLEARLAQDSHNSGKPPSSDPPFKKVGRSQRQASGRQPGGQSGRRGVTRSLVEDPDQHVVIPLTGTCTCGRVQRRAFPEAVMATVQYGPSVSALAVYLTQYQFLPYQRTAEVFHELAGIAISPGVVVNF